MTPPATVELVTAGEVALVTVSGLVDERFVGFGDLGAASSVVLDVAGVTRMTSFGVRQWLAALEALPASLAHLYLLGCPTFFVDHLNMMMSFGGAATILTVAAPYRCPECEHESNETIDVLAERHTLARDPPDRECARCGAKLELDEAAESYFAFLAKYTAASLDGATAELLASQDLYVRAEAGDKPPQITKLVRGGVTHFRIAGNLGKTFRGRPLLDATGEVVIDFSDVERFDAGAQREWRQTIKTLASQASSIALVDLPSGFLATVGDTLSIARNIATASVRLPYQCIACGRLSSVSHVATDLAWPPRLDDGRCEACGEVTRCRLPADALAPLQKASTRLSSAAADAISDRTTLAPPEPEPESDAGLILGKYEIIRRVSAAGSTEVFLAKLVGLGVDKSVTIRRIRTTAEHHRRVAHRFLEDARLAAKLSHANLAHVFDAGDSAGAFYLASEFVHGKDLWSTITALAARGQRMAVDDACYIAREIAQGLEYAYTTPDASGKRMMLVHGALAPHDVMLSFAGEVKLTDVGIADGVLAEHERAAADRLPYLAPEVARHGRAAHRSDLFSLGAILYALCTGVIPASPIDQARLAELPPALSALIVRLLEPEADFRPAGAGDVVAALTRVIEERALASSPERLAALLAATFPSGTAPLVTDGVGIKIETAPDEPRTRRPRVSSIQMPMSRPSSPTKPPLAVIREEREPRYVDGLINLALGVAIVVVVLVGAYLIVSRY